MVAPFIKVYGKIWVGFCLNTGKRFFVEVSFESQQKAQALLKNDTRDFQNSLLFKRLARFYVTVSGNFDRFQQFNFERDFLENENFQKNRMTFFS